MSAHPATIPLPDTIPGDLEALAGVAGRLLELERHDDPARTAAAEVGLEHLLELVAHLPLEVYVRHLERAVRELWAFAAGELDSDPPPSPASYCTDPWAGAAARYATAGAE